MDNFNRVQEVNGELMNANGQLEEGYGVYLDSVEASANRAQTALEKMWVDSLDSNLIKSFFDATTAIATLVGKLNVLRVGLVALGTILMITNDKYKEWIGTNTKMRGLTEKESKALTEKIKQVGFLKAITGQLTNEETKSISVKALLAMGVGRLKDMLTMTNVVMVATKVGAIALRLALTALLSFGISLVLEGLMSLISGFTGASEASNDMATEIDGNIKSFQNNVKALSDIREEFDTLREKMGSDGKLTKLTADEQERYNELAEQIADIAPEAVSHINDKGEAIIKYGTEISTLIDKEKELIEVEKQRILSEEANEVKDVEGGRWKKFKGKVAEKHIDNKIGAQETNMLSVRDEDVERVAKIRTELASLHAQKKVMAADGVQERAGLQKFLDIHFEEIEALELVGQATKDVMRERVSDTLRDEGYYQAKQEVFQYADALEILAGTIDETDVGQLGEDFDVVKQTLIDLGWDASVAEEFLWDFKLATDEVGMAQQKMAEALAFSTDEFKEMKGSVDELSEMYSTLASGEKLTFEEMTDLIEGNQEIADYIANTQDLTLQNGELILDMMDKERNAMHEKLGVAKQDAEVQKVKAEEAVAQQEKLVESLTRRQGEESAHSQREIESLNEKKERLAELTIEYDNFANQMQALDTLSGNAFKQDDLEAAQASFSAATAKLKDYQDILEEIDEFGQLSGETNAEIFMQHSELIDLIGHEGDMRIRIMEIMDEQQEVQQDMYIKGLEANEKYSEQMFEYQRDLYIAMAELYGLDLDEFTTIQELKAEVAAKAARSIAGRAAEAARSIGATNLENAKSDRASSKSTMNKLKSHGNSGYGPRVQKNNVGLKPGGTIGGLMTKEYNEARKFNEFSNLQVREIEASNARLQNAGKLPNFGRPNFTSKRPKAGSSVRKAKSPKGRTGGSSKNKDKKEKDKPIVESIELQTEAYWKYEKALIGVNTQLERNNQLLSLSSGADRVKLLSQEVALLKEKQNIQHKTANQYRAESKNLQAKLSKDIYLQDGTMGVNSFNVKTKMMEKEINRIIGLINATQDDDKRKPLEKKQEDLKKEYETFRENFKRYIDIEFDLIPQLSTDWGALDIQKFNHSLEALEISYEKFGRRIDNINDKMVWMLDIRQDNAEEVKEEMILLGQVSMVYKGALQDIGRDIAKNTKNLKEHEKWLKSNTDRRSDDYKMHYDALIKGRALEDKLFQIQRENVNAYAGSLKDSVSAYTSQMNHAKDETLKGLRELREEIERFSEIDFQIDLGNILADLDAIDKIFIEDADWNLETTVAREGIANLKTEIMDTVTEIEDMKTQTEAIMKDVEGVSALEPLNPNQADNKAKLLNKFADQLEEVTDRQIAKETELKKLREEMRVDIEETKLNYKLEENSLNNKIDLKQEELDKLQEEFEYENKIRQMLQKQLELMRAMDDTRHSYITGQGEETFTYDRDRVSQLRQALEESQKEEAKSEATEKMQEEIEEMRKHLEKTREINQLQLDVLTQGMDSVDELVGVLGGDVDNNLDKFEDIFESLITTVEDKFKAVMDVATKGLQEILDEYFKRAAVQPNRPVKPDIAPNTLKPDPKVGLKSGGYTGNDEGVAMLHKKELVLNAEDTRNMLEAVKVTDSFAKNMPNTSAYNSKTINKNEGGDVVMHNPTFTQVKDIMDFSNEMNKMLRRGMPNLS